MNLQDQRPVDVTGIFVRAKALLLSPVAEWAKIDDEPATVGSLYTGYVAPLAAIGPICGLVFGYGLWIVRFGPSLGAAVSHAIIEYLLSLGIIFVLARTIDELAPSFGGQRNPIQALKVAAYSFTAIWAAGILSLLPGLGLLGLLAGLYSVYLLYLGLPRLMKTPEAQAPAYVSVIIIAATMLSLGGGMIASSVAGLSVLSPMGMTMPGIGTNTVDPFDRGRPANSPPQSGSLARPLDPAKPAPPPVTPVSGDALKALLPDNLPGGFNRTESQTNTGAGFSRANASYSSLGKSLTVSIIDLGAAGAGSSQADSFRIDQDRETATGFDRVGRVAGRVTIEQYDRNTQKGRYAVLLADRFIIDAQGIVGTFYDLKNAVDTVGPERVLKLGAAPASSNLAIAPGSPAR